VWMPVLDRFYDRLDRSHGENISI